MNVKRLVIIPVPLDSSNGKGSLLIETYTKINGYDYSITINYEFSDNNKLSESGKLKVHINGRKFDVKPRLLKSFPEHVSRVNTGLSIHFCKSVLRSYLDSTFMLEYCNSKDKSLA